MPARIAPGVVPTLKKSDFHYELPPELIAQSPLPERSASRMLVVAPVPAAFADRQVRDLPEFLQPGDLLVFNDTRVIPARLFGQKDSGGRVAGSPQTGHFAACTGIQGSTLRHSLGLASAGRDRHHPSERRHRRDRRRVGAVALAS